MRILVTGGAGFIGSHVVDGYVAAGHEVIILDTHQHPSNHAGVVWCDVDLVDRVATRHVLMALRPDVINHHAARYFVPQSVADPRASTDIDLIGFLNLLEAGAEVGVGRFIVASSAGALYSDFAPRPTPESGPVLAHSPYGATKLALEGNLASFAVQHEFNWCVLRYGNVYGPRQRPQGLSAIVPTMLEQLANSQQPVIFGDGEQTRDYVFVADVVSANLLALERGDGIYNIGTGIGTSVNQLVAVLEEVIGQPITATSGPSRRGDPRHSVLDSTRAHEELNWRPTVMLTEGLRQTVAWFQAQAAERVAYAYSWH